MTNSRIKRRSTRDPQIDAAGWLYLLFAVAIVVSAGVIAYEGSTVTPAPVSHLASR